MKRLKKFIWLKFILVRFRKLNCIRLITDLAQRLSQVPPYLVHSPTEYIKDHTAWYLNAPYASMELKKLIFNVF